MRADAWAQYCRAALIRSISAAAARFPGPGETAPERIHEARKALKQARAIARLFRNRLGEPARATAAALGAMRRQTGRARDLYVMALRLRRLAPPPEVLDPLLAAIARERSALSARPGLPTRGPRARLTVIAGRLEGWDLSAVGADEIAAAVGRTYRQARRRGRVAFDGGDPAALHALRARVADLRCQLELLSCAWPEALKAQVGALNALREALGDFNDFDVLGKFAAKHGGLAPQALDDLGARMAAKQKKLKRRARAGFDRLFAETPAAFAARIAAYLDHPMIKPDIRANEPALARAPPDGAAGA